MNVQNYLKRHSVEAKVNLEKVLYYITEYKLEIPHIEELNQAIKALKEIENELSNGGKEADISFIFDTLNDLYYIDGIVEGMQFQGSQEGFLRQVSYLIDSAIDVFTTYLWEKLPVLDSSKKHLD